MRKSNRGLILDAAFAVIQQDGVRGLTYESLASATGLTKGGLLYHFPSRDALIIALHQRLADQWESQLMAIYEGGSGLPEPDRRLDAYVRSTVESATRAELLLLLETADEPELSQPWDRVLEHWAPPVPDRGDAAGVDAFIARLAADGLWLYEALAADSLPVELRDLLITRINAAGRTPDQTEAP